MLDHPMSVANNPRLGAMIAVLASDGLGRNTLPQLLFMADIAYFVRYRESISHAQYWKVITGALPEGISETLPRLQMGGIIEVSPPIGDEATGPLYCCKNMGPAWALLTRTEFQFLAEIRDRLSGYSETYLLKIIVHLHAWRSAELAGPINFRAALDDPFLQEWLQDHCLGSPGWAHRIFKQRPQHWPAIYATSAQARRVREQPLLEIAK